MKHIKFCLLVTLFVFSPIVTAASWYQVELVVFDRLNPNLDGEQWQNEVFALRDNLVELQTAAGVSPSGLGLIPYMVLDNRSQSSRWCPYRFFKLSSQYRPLIHLSWQQPATRASSNHAFVHLVKGWMVRIHLFPLPNSSHA